MNNPCYVYVASVVKWGRKEENPTTMDKDKAKRLGQYLRDAREAMQLSSRQLATRTGLKDATIVRIELGEFAAPSPDKLARLADALGLPLEDVYALAEYSAPSQLPSLSPYLRTKYRGLPTDDVDRIQAYAARLAKRHGVDLSGPAPGEDESPEPTKSSTKKGGTSHVTTKRTRR